MRMVCYWENGNPPSAARLLNEAGVEVATSEEELLRHTIQNVSWRDAGTWECQVPRAVENKTATLTVKGEGRPLSPMGPAVENALDSSTTLWTLPALLRERISSSHANTAPFPLLSLCGREPELSKCLSLKHEASQNMVVVLLLLLLLLLFPLCLQPGILPIQLLPSGSFSFIFGDSSSKIIYRVT